MKYVFGFDGSQASHAALVQAFKCILRDGDDLYLLGCVNDPTEVEGISEGFVGFNVEDEDAKMQSSAARKIKKTIKAALDKYPKRVTMTIHTTSSTNPGEAFANMAPSIQGADALIVGYDEKKGVFSHPSNALHALNHSSIPCIVIGDHAGSEAMKV